MGKQRYRHYRIDYLKYTNDYVMLFDDIIKFGDKRKSDE